jgi:hypothetical protein
MGIDEAGPRQVAVGAHALAFEPPDPYIWTARGYMSEAQAADAVAMVNSFAEGKRRVFGIIIGTHTGPISQGARERLLGVTRLVAAISYVGWRPAHRLALAHLNVDRKKIRGGHSASISFVESEAEGRAWVEVFRRRVEMADRRVRLSEAPVRRGAM